MRAKVALSACLALFASCDACGNPASTTTAAPAAARELGERVTPPFAVRGEGTGLLLVWFDAEGPHTASSRTGIPAEHRDIVRVDSLTLEPEKRLDPAFVYVADLRAEGDVEHPVRKVGREDLDERLAVKHAKAPPPANAPTPSAPGTAHADVIIYGASWCGACRSAARFFRARGIPFAEKDIEQDPAALAEMQNKTRAAGVRPSGIPVIDFRGTILPGFSEQQIEALLSRQTI